jgi:hypothetical protein
MDPSATDGQSTSSIESLDAKIEISLYEEIDSPENAAQGSFKTPLTSRDGTLITCSAKKSPYKFSVEGILYADGWEDDTKKQAMTLVVLTIKLNCTDLNGRYRSVEMSIDFEDLQSTPKNTRAKPTVVAFAPFAKTDRWNESEAEWRRKYYAEAEVGASNMAEVKAKAGVESETTSHKHFFDQGSAWCNFSYFDARRNGVVWFMRHNTDQGHGVPPEMQVAVLLSRASDAEFNATYRMRLNAGTIQNFLDKAQRIFNCSRQKPSSFPIKPQEIPRSAYEGKTILKKIDLKQLGKLAEGDMLHGLTFVTGLVEPLENVKAEENKGAERKKEVEEKK